MQAEQSEDQLHRHTDIFTLATVKIGGGYQIKILYC